MSDHEITLGDNGVMIENVEWIWDDETESVIPLHDEFDFESLIGLNTTVLIRVEGKL